jgi:hypothetical protein
VPKGGTVEAYLELMDDPAVYPVLVHCKHGAGRSVLFSALYRIEYEGWSPAEALDATTPVRRFGGFADDEKKGRFLKSYVPRRARELSAGAPTGATTSAAEPAPAGGSALPGGGER